MPLKFGLIPEGYATGGALVIRFRHGFIYSFIIIFLLFFFLNFLYMCIKKIIILLEKIFFFILLKIKSFKLKKRKIHLKLIS